MRAWVVNANHAPTAATIRVITAKPFTAIRGCERSLEVSVSSHNAIASSEIPSTTADMLIRTNIV
jgi:hypothetical protein